MRGEQASKNHPCPICFGTSWCLIFTHSVLCMRSTSNKPHQMPHGLGHWFQMDGGSFTQAPRREVRQEPEQHVDFGILLKEWQRQTSANQMASLANNLGVRASALIDLGACWADPHSAYAFPMTDGFGNVVGIRLRNFLGDKWAVRGSKSGIFMPKVYRDDIAIIVEGPTDSCAVLSMGGMPIGRPSCSGGVMEILHAIGRWKIRKVIIIADNDEDKKRPDGSVFNPGMDGAKALQAQLPVPSCMVVLPCKDIRQFLNCGCTSHDLECIASSMEWKYPTIHEQQHIRVDGRSYGM